jgi:hypothetical protein
MSREDDDTPPAFEVAKRDPPTREEAEAMRRRLGRAHHCHARGCEVAVPPRLLMCARHWRMVPTNIKRRVWLWYRDGQEERKDPSPEYLRAADDAIEAVARKERR